MIVIMNYIEMFAIPCVCMCLDIVTGYIAAAYNGKVDSTTMGKGLWKKLSEVAAMVVSVICEFALSVYGGGLFSVNANIPITAAVCAYLAFSEIVSCCENIGSINPDTAAFMRDRLGISSDKLHKQD